MSSEELAMLPLEPGKNMATYHVPALEVTISTLLCFVSLIQYISSSWASNHFSFDIHFSRSPYTLTSSSSPADRSSSSQMLMERLQGCCRWTYHLWVCNCAQGRRGCCCCCCCCRWSYYLCVCIIAPREDVMGFVLPSVVGITHHQVFFRAPAKHWLCSTTHKTQSAKSGIFRTKQNDHSKFSTRETPKYT